MNTQVLNEERFSRQKGIVPPDRLAACQATVIGVGAIGRQVALQLTAIGIPWLQLVDFDLVEVSNLASQGYLEKDLHRTKVTATADLCLQINPKLEIKLSIERFRRSLDIGNIVFVCVDTIDIRRFIWQAVKDKVLFLADGRMAAELIRVVTAFDPASYRHYPDTLFTASEAHVGTCTAKSTIYTANIAAGLMLGQFTQWLRNLPMESDVAINLLSMEISCLTERSHA